MTNVAERTEAAPALSPEIESRLKSAVKSAQGSTVIRRIGPFMPLLIIVAWELCSRLGVIDARFFPAPTAILDTFWQMLVNGSLIEDIGITLSRIGIGFVMGAVPGIVLGLLLGSVRPLRQLLEPIFASLLPIPKIAIFPLLLLIFGLGETSKYLIVAIGARSVPVGIRPRQRHAPASFRISSLPLFRGKQRGQTPRCCPSPGAHLSRSGMASCIRWARCPAQFRVTEPGSKKITPSMASANLQ